MLILIGLALLAAAAIVRDVRAHRIPERDTPAPIETVHPAPDASTIPYR